MRHIPPISYLIVKGRYTFPRALSRRNRHLFLLDLRLRPPLQRAAWVDDLRHCLAGRRGRPPQCPPLSLPLRLHPCDPVALNQRLQYAVKRVSSPHKAARVVEIRIQAMDTSLLHSQLTTRLCGRILAKV